MRQRRDGWGSDEDLVDKEAQQVSKTSTIKKPVSKPSTIKKPQQLHKNRDKQVLGGLCGAVTIVDCAKQRPGRTVRSSDVTAGLIFVTRSDECVGETDFKEAKSTTAFIRKRPWDGHPQSILTKISSKK